MTGPSPADTAGGHTVRVRVKGNTWTSPVLSPTVAQQLGEQIIRSLEESAHGFELVGFVCDDGTTFRVRCREVLHVEYGPVRREEPLPAGLDYSAPAVTPDPDLAERQMPPSTVRALKAVMEAPVNRPTPALLARGGVLHPRDAGGGR